MTLLWKSISVAVCSRSCPARRVAAQSRCCAAASEGRCSRVVVVADDRPFPELGGTRWSMLACWIPPVVAVTREPARPPRRTHPAQQRPALSRRSSAHGGDHRRHALRRRRLAWRACPGADRDPLAIRVAHPGSAVADRADLDPRRGSVLVRRGKGGRRREIGMDVWGFEHVRPWLEARRVIPVGPLFCVIDGRTRGRA